MDLPETRESSTPKIQGFFWSLPSSSIVISTESDADNLSSLG